MKIEITFPGGKQVNALVGEEVIRTDQSKKDGGEGLFPAPFSLFLASMGTCAGIYALSFCQNRHLPTEGLHITQENDFDSETHLLTRVRFLITLPAEFPDKYRDALIRTVEHCAVKKAIVSQPTFEIAISSSSSEAR